MEPIGIISTQAKEPEVKIETWFNETRLKKFAASFEKVPLLWHVQHIDCDDIAPRSAEYLLLLDSLGEPCAGELRARVTCAKALCRVFCRLLRQKLRWAATKSLLDGTGEERALGMLPYWARQAERYMRYLPLVYLNTEQELKTKAEKAASSQRANEKRAQQQPTTRNLSSSSQGRSSNSGNNKGSRPPPVPVPIAPEHKPSQTTAGRQLMQRVACGMRRAAKIHGLGRKAVVLVAREIGNQEAQVHALWSSMQVLARAKLKALLARGDGRARSQPAHLSSLDWAVADLLIMYEFSPVHESSFDEYKQQLALIATFHLVQRFELETLGQEPSPHKWHEAARWYCKTGAVMSPVGLQRRWHALKEHTRRALAPDARLAPDTRLAPDARLTPDAGDTQGLVRPLHRLIAKKYPHVVTGRLRAWPELLAADLVARPTNERGSKKRQHTEANNESTEKDNSPVINDEMNTLVGDKAEVSGEKSRDPSVRSGPSKSVRIIDNSLPQATSSSEVSSEENSNHVHTNEVQNRHKENIRGEGYQKNIVVNKEIIDLDAPSEEFEELKRLQGLDVRSASNIDTEVVKEEDIKNNVDINVKIIDLDAPSAKFEEFNRLQGLDDRSASYIGTKVVKEEYFKDDVDVNKEIINLDAPSAESEELKRYQGLDGTSASKIDTEVVKDEDFKNNIDVNKEIIYLDAPSAESEELNSRQGLDDRNAFNIVEGSITSKPINTPNTDDFATQVIRAIGKEIFYGSSKFSKNNECNTTQNCGNVSNSKIQPSSKESNSDGIEKVTSSSQINTNKSNSSVGDAVHKHPMLTQMLQTVCMFDDDAELNAFLNKNKEVNRKDNSSNINVTLNTNAHENKIKSLVENKTRKRVRAKLTDDWAQDIVRAIKRQRLESAKLQNPQMNNLIEKEPSRGNVDKSHKSNDSEHSKSVTKLDSDDEFYFFNVSSDDEDSSQNSEIREDSIDPKLLMYPVVVMTRIENDPSLRIVPKLPLLSKSRSPSPNLSNLILESPSPSNIKSEKIDRDSGADDTPLFVNTPEPEILNEKTRALLKLFKPCEVLLERLEDVDKGIGRLAKRVELQDIDVVRRNNRRVLTAQVAPLAQDSESSSSDSRDSDWTPDMDTTRKKTTNKNSDSISDSDSETDDIDANGDDDENDHDDDEIINPSKAEDLKDSDDHLKQMLNDFVDGPADGECCRRNKRTQLRGELAATASLAMKRNCARCLWRLLSAPPASAGEARLQRRLLRHTVLQATSTAPKVTEIPKQIPNRTKQIPRETKQISSGTKQIPSGIKEIPSGTKQIPCETKQIPSGTKQIPSGTKQKEIPSETKQIPKQIAGPRSTKKSLPAPPASRPATNAAPAIQYQGIASAADRPLPAAQPSRTNTVKQVRLAPKEPAGPSTVPKNPERRSSASLFRPGAVADINEKLGKLVENQPPPAPGAFDPVITSVLSLAPPQAKDKKCPLVPKMVKLLKSNLAPTARDVVEKTPATNGVTIPSNSAQPHFNTLQPCNAAQSHNSQSAQFETDPTQCLNMSNALQPQMNHPTSQHLPGTTHLSPAAQTVVGQMGSQNFALQGTGNVIFDPNRVAGNVMQAPGLQNAPWNNQGNCIVKQETSVFHAVMPVNADQPNPMYIESNQPNPMQINQNQPNPMYTQPNQPNSMYMQPNQSNPIYIQPNQPNPMYMQPNQPNSMYIQQNQPNPMQINQNQPNPMCIQPNRSNPVQINQNQPSMIYIQPNQPNPMQINQNQPSTMYIQPNQPNPMQIDQNQPWKNQGNCLVKQETSAFQPVMPINSNQPNPMYTQPNQPNLMYMNPNQNNPIYINPNQAELMNIQPSQPNLIPPNPMYINPNQSNAMHTNPNQTNSIYPNQMYVNPNQLNSMQINPNQPNPIYPAPMHVNPNQSMYIDQNQLNLMNPTQINQPIVCPNPMPIKTEQGSSYLPPVSHPNPYCTDPGHSPTVPILGSSTLTGISLPNAFTPVNAAGTLQTLFNSMQGPSQPQSYQRPPSYDEAVAISAGSQQGSMQGPSQFEDSKPTMLAVDVKIGNCHSGNELYDKLNSFTRLKWHGRPLSSHEWVKGRDPSRLAVLCTRSHRDPWALLGSYLVLSEEEPPPPNFDVWALNPRVRLRLPHERQESATEASAKPARLQVKSFARVENGQGRQGKPGPHAYAKVKLSDNPRAYAKLLVAVPNANVCRQLLKRGGPIQLYDIQTCLLHPILSKPTGPDSQFSLSGEAPVFPALRELARQLMDDRRVDITLN